MSCQVSGHVCNDAPLSAKHLVQDEITRSMYLSAEYSLLGDAEGSRLGIRGSAELLPFLVQSRNPICPLQAYRQHFKKSKASTAAHAESEFLSFEHIQHKHHGCT